ncbi:hypothetical protein EMCRGX_G007555 [Ephydatia muelleri]
MTAGPLSLAIKLQVIQKSKGCWFLCFCIVTTGFLVQSEGCWFLCSTAVLSVSLLASKRLPLLVYLCIRLGCYRSLLLWVLTKIYKAMSRFWIRRSGNEATSIKITVGDDDIIDDLVDIALERLKMSVAKDTVTVKFQGNVVNKAESLAAYMVITSNQKPLELEWKVEGREKRSAESDLEDMPKEEAFEDLVSDFQHLRLKCIICTMH